MGIDHDRCLMFRDIRPLKLEYSELPVLREPINPEMTELFSTQALVKYAQIMRESDVPATQIDWLRIVANVLNEAVEREDSFYDTILTLQTRYNNEFLTD